MEKQKGCGGGGCRQNFPGGIHPQNTTKTPQNSQKPTKNYKKTQKIHKKT